MQQLQTRRLQLILQHFPRNPRLSPRSSIEQPPITHHTTDQDMAVHQDIILLHTARWEAWAVPMAA